jgi:ABC-type branched-subunit amino acid transport system substrate-binding protein
MGLVELVSGGAPRRLTPRSALESLKRVCAIACALTIGLSLAACETMKMAPPPRPMVMAPPPPPPPPPRPLRMDQPSYFRLRNTPANAVPARVALLLPLGASQTNVRNLAESLERAAELALFDSGNKNIILMPRDDGGTPEKAAAAAAKAIDDGAEIILGPLFAQSVAAVAPIARGQNVPVVAFSSDRSVGGRGVYLLSFQPETEVRRIVSYAAAHGHNAFAALVPRSPYGDIVSEAFRASVNAAGGSVTTVQPFEERTDAITQPATAIAQSGADSVLIGEGGALLQALGPALSGAGANSRMTKFLGTGLWDDAAVQREPMFANGWFAAPPPAAFRDFAAHYRRTYGANPPRIATLAYDAVSLVALLSGGKPYDRFTDTALVDPNGFSGVDGLFRFRDNGSAERGLAILQVAPNGFTVVDPAPRSFPAAGF